MQILKGQIWLISIPVTKGSLQHGFRPAIICSNNSANYYSNVLHCVPVTSQVKKWMPTHVKINKSCGLLTDSTILCEQIMATTKDSLVRYIGVCSDETINKINHALMIQLDLTEEKHSLYA